VVLFPEEGYLYFIKELNMLRRHVAYRRFLTICSTICTLTAVGILFSNCSQPFYFSELLDGISGIQLTVTPASVQLLCGESVTIVTSGGKTPYEYTLVQPLNGTGELLSNSLYTAPDDVTGNAIIQVADSYGNLQLVNISVVSVPTGSSEVLSVSPSALSIYTGTFISLTGAGGQSPYTYTLTSPIGGSGEILVGSTYTAPSDTTGTALITVTDSDLDSAVAMITVLSAATTPLSISPVSVNLNLNGSMDFSATGGTPPYSYTLVAATGGTGESLEGATYTAPSDMTGSATVRVSDSDSNSADASINITASSVLSLIPAVLSLDTEESFTFTGSGGIPPYTFTLDATESGTATIGSTDGVYAAGNTAGTDTVVVTDNMGNTADASVTVSSPSSAVNYDTVVVINSGDSMGGGSMEGSFSFVNNGTSNGSYPVTWGVYFSLDDELGAGDTLAVSGSTTALDAGSSSGDILFSGTWNIPSSDTLYYLIVEIRSSDDLIEADNCGFISETVTAPDPADIDYIVESISYSPVSADAGSAITQNFTILNQGDDPGVYNLYWKVYSSEDQSFDGTDSLLSSGSTAALTASGTENISIDGTWPVSAGLYYLIVNVSAGDDTNPSNNYTASDVFTINSITSEVDYKVSNISKGYPTISSGGFCSETFDISNIGGADGAGEISWTAYASLDNVPDSSPEGDSVIGSGTLTALSSGSSNSSINVAGTWPDAAGSYYLIVVVSASDDLLTGNNTTYNSLYRVIDPPDYIINTAMLSTGGGTPGVLLSYTGYFIFDIAETAGADGAQMIGWEVFASFDSSLDGTDISIMSGSHLPLSASETSESVNFSSGTWPEMGGSYYFIISVSAGDEINSSNNTYVSSQSYSSPAPYSEPEGADNDTYDTATDLTVIPGFETLGTNEEWLISGTTDAPGYDTYRFILGDNINALNLTALWNSSSDEIDLDLLNEWGSSIWNSSDSDVNQEPQSTGDPADIYGLTTGGTYYLRVQSKNINNTGTTYDYTVSVYGHRLW
jgi:hypothetical protein